MFLPETDDLSVHTGHGLQECWYSTPSACLFEHGEEGLTIEEQVDSVLVGKRLHGGTHLFKLLVAGVSGVPASDGGALNDQ